MNAISTASIGQTLSRSATGCFPIHSAMIAPTIDRLEMNTNHMIPLMTAYCVGEEFGADATISTSMQSEASALITQNKIVSRIGIMCGEETI